MTAEKKLTALAKVSDVLTAYLAIGVKANTTSIQQTMVTKQRDIENIDYKAFEMSEAYVIARLLRKIEAERFELITGVKL